MPTLTPRVTDTLLAELNLAATAQEMTVSELARKALVDFMQPQRTDDLTDRPAPTVDVPSGLSAVQRHEIALLHRILARLVRAEDGDGFDGDFDHQIGLAEIVEGGYAARYAEVFASLDPELSSEEGEEVWDVLDMFRVLESSYEGLSEEDRAGLDDTVARRVQFRGFDANDRFESRLLHFAQDEIKNEKWEELAVYFDRAHDHGNSHTRRMGEYRRMLSVFDPMWRRKVRKGSIRFSAAEISRITDAAVHPDRR